MQLVMWQREDVVLKVVRREVRHQIGQPGQMVNEQNGDVLFVETVVFERIHNVPLVV